MSQAVGLMKQCNAEFSAASFKEWLALNSRRLIRPGHFEAVGGVAIPMGAGHAADGLEAVADDALGFRLDQLIADVDALDEADDEAVVADLNRAPFLALQAGGGLGDARRFHRGRGQG